MLANAKSEGRAGRTRLVNGGFLFVSPAPIYNGRWVLLDRGEYRNFLYVAGEREQTPRVKKQAPIGSSETG